MAQKREVQKSPRRDARKAKAKPTPVVRPPKAAAQPRTTADRTPLITAGIGASAGGLEAFSQVLEAMPAKPGLAIVLVQHLAPQHESALPVLLAGRTELPVVQATEGMQVERDHIYVIPPNVQMSIHDDMLHLAARPSDRTQYTPIDHFLHSLANAAQDRSVAVILSGTASDGTAGVAEIKAVGGITIAQDPETATYDGMPRAAIAGGFIDLVLSPAEIAAELVAIARHPLKQRADEFVEASPQRDEAQRTTENSLEQIFALLASATGVDFRRYKRPTILRRLQRRLVLHKQTRLDQYLRYMRANSAEVYALYSDILIHVTRFFRDRDAFTAIQQHVLPRILEERADDQPIRVWVPGCSSGEEAYSIAMLVLEYLGKQGRHTPLQVFATDISEPTIDHARAGIYPESIAADVSAERLRRFFVKMENSYRITKSVRDVCVFARHDITRDPPFSKLDLILCRNLLIYLGTELQQKLVEILHYALKPGGTLVLGSAETIGPNTDLFGTIDRQHRIYERKSGVASTAVAMHVEHGSLGVARARRAPPPAERDAAHAAESEATRFIQDRYAPPGVIVDANLNVVQFRGQTGAFLEPAPGEPSMNLLKMTREGLLHDLREGLQSARKRQTSVRKRGLRVRSDGRWRSVNIEIAPLPVGDRLHFLVLFDDVSSGASKHRERRRSADGADADGAGKQSPNQRVSRLQQELTSSREYLQSIIQDLEAANEELQSANEEVLSANEELQSTNEELDTAKEELQSTNEELNTVNEELHGRNEELSRANSDLVNLLSSVQIAIVIVSGDLRLRRFTPMAEKVLNLIGGDVGRPIGHIKPNIECPDLAQLITHVIDTVTPYEREVHDLHGASFSLNIRPYKSLDNRIDGAVLALFPSGDADGARRARQADTKAIIDTAREPIVLLGDGLRVRHVNRAFAEAFGVAADAVAGRSLYEVADGQWDIERLRGVLETELRSRPAVHDVEIEHDFRALGRKRIIINATRIGADGDDEGLVVLALEDTERRGGRGNER